MESHLQYGHHGLDIQLPFNHVTELRPQFVPGIADEHEGFETAVRSPINSPPLADQIHADDTVAVVIADITRPLPSDRLLKWLFAELDHVPAKNFRIIIGTGSHRATTAAEIEQIVGKEIATNYHIVDHTAYDYDELTIVGYTTDKQIPLHLNKAYVNADRRIVIGFIEPHFMAGFSGGYKGIFPAVAGIRAIMHYHRAEAIGHPKSTWGVLDGNPTQAQIRQYGSVIPLDFCINVTLNHQRQITRFFCGDPLAAHDQGCAFVRETAMVACERPFPIVITSNSGYPLDQNLYQTVKGMCAAAEVVQDDGLIITAARCNDGFPSHGNFTKLLLDHDSPQSLLDTIFTPGFHMLDQWQVQKLAQVQLKAQVALYSELPPTEVARVRIEPIADINALLQEKCMALGKDVPVAILPEGPMTIPYLI
ncbi:MAG: nickel-dependent lactate racemase [Chloroflexi bacterium]|nr:nickel-dependent lactate racemase [Chloroflexota bacterium]